MTAPPTGRDLDRAVAVAMGLRPIPASVPRSGDWLCDWQRNATFSETTGWAHRHLPAYSTDPACLDEMLAWLVARGQPEIALVESDDGGDLWEAYLAPRSIPQRGSTIYEAVARLVVAVAEAQK